MSKKTTSPIGFGRTPMPDEAGQEPVAEQPAKKPLAPPLAEPVALDDVAAIGLMARYQLMPLVPLAKFEYQLLEIIAGLEQRIRELDPDAE